MKWYEIVIAIPAIIIGAYLGIKLKEFRNGIFQNDLRFQLRFVAILLHTIQ